MTHIGLFGGFTLPEVEAEGPVMGEKQAAIQATTATFAEGVNPSELSKLLDEKKKLIEEGESLVVRQASEARAKSFRERELVQSVRTALIGTDTAVGALEIFREQKQKLDETIQEQFAVDNLRRFAKTDPQFFAILERNRDFLERDDDRLAKDMIIANVAAEWEAKRDNWLADLADIPEAILGADIENTLSLDRAELYKEVQAKKEELSPAAFREWLTRRLEEVDESLFFDNNDRIADLAGQLADEDISASVNANQADAVYAILSLVGAAELKSLKGSSILPKSVLNKSFKSEAVIATGGASKVGEDVAKVIREGSEQNANIVSSANEAIAYAMAGKLPWEQWDGVPAQVKKNLEVNERILQELEELPIGHTLSAEDLEFAAEELAKKYKANYHKGSLAEVKWVHDDAGNLSGLQLNILNESGTPFASKELAQQYAKDKKLKDFLVYQDKATGGYGILKTEKIDPTDLSPTLRDYKEVGYFKTVLFQPDEFIARNLMSLSRASEKSISRISEVFRETWKTTVGKLNSKDREKLGALMEGEKLRWTKDKHDWLNQDQFVERWISKYGEPPQNKHINAYLGARQLEDTAWRLINGAVYKKRLREGLGTVRVKDLPEDVPASFSGRAVKPTSVEEGEIIYDAVSDRLVRVGGDFKDSVSKDELVGSADEFDFIRVGTDEDAAKGGIEFHVMRVKKGQADIGDLDPMQVGYVPHGRIFYDYNFLVSSHRKAKLPSGLGGGTMVRSPLRLFGGRNRAEVREFAEKLEKIRTIALQAQKGSLAREEANRQIIEVGLPRFQDYDTFADFMRSRGASLEDEIVFGGDRQPPAVNREAGEFLSKPKMDVEFQTFKTRWNSARTEHRLEDVRGEVSLLDPFESLTSSLNGAARLAAFSDFKQEAIDMFARTFGKYMSVKPGKGVSNMDVLLSDIAPQFKTTLNSKTKAAIWAHKQQILHTIRHRTPTEELWSSIADGIADYFFSKGVTNVADKFSKSRMASPAGKIKAYSFNARMGFFNPGQFLLQASAALNGIALSPKYGLKAATSVWPARIALAARDPEVTKELARKIGNTSLWDGTAEDFQEFVTLFRDLGFNDFGRNISEIDAAVRKHYTSGALSKFVEDGKFFFAEGERVVRLTNAGIAYRKWKFDKDINPKGLPASSDKGREFIMNETERLTLGTTGADVQIFARGIRGVPFQFWSYPFRMVTTLFGKRLTGREKAQLLSMYVLTAGAAGVPFGSWMLAKAQKEGIVELDKEEGIIAYNGLIDYMIYAASDGELETDWSSRVGAGTLFEDIFKAYTEDPFLTLIGGPTGQSLGRGFESLLDSLRPIIASRTTSIEQVGHAAIKTLGTQITSVDKAYKLLVALETKKLIDSKGRVFKDKVSEAEIYADLLAGIPLAERDKTFERLEDLNYIKEKAQQFAEDIHLLRMKAYDAPDAETKALYEQQINALAHYANNLGIYSDVQRHLNRKWTQPGFAESVYRNYMEKKYMGAKTNPALEE